MGEAKLREARWHGTMRTAQVALLDAEASARGLTRTEMFLVVMTEGLDRARSQRLLGQSEPKASITSRVEQSEAKPSKPAPAARPAAKAATSPAKGLASVIRPVDGFATENPSSGRPDVSTVAVEALGTELGDNPFEALNMPAPKSAPVKTAQPEVGENPWDALDNP